MDWHKGKRAIARAIDLDLTHNQEYYASALRRHARPGVRWLDVGCGHRIVPDWAMPAAEQECLVQGATYLVGIDVDDGIEHHPLLDHRVKALVGRLPFRDGAFDLVSANMVVEHIPDPMEFLRDIHRVLRPGGHFLFVTPNVLSPLMLISKMIPAGIKGQLIKFLEGREEDDVFPAFYRMNKVRVIADLAKATGFETKELKFIGSVGEFGRLGPISWFECFLLKGIQASFDGKLQPDILGVLQRPIMA